MDRKPLTHGLWRIESRLTHLIHNPLIFLKTFFVLNMKKNFDFILFIRVFLYLRSFKYLKNDKIIFILQI